MVFPSHSKAKSSLPSAKSRDTSIFSNIQSEDLALQLDTQETMKAYSSQVYVYHYQYLLMFFICHFIAVILVKFIDTMLIKNRDLGYP